jgi:hypothetical protein
MFKICTGFLAVTLAVSSIGASAQSTASRGDMFGQDLPSTDSAVAAPSAPPKVRITNTKRRGLQQGVALSLQQSTAQCNRSCGESVGLHDEARA